MTEPFRVPKHEVPAEVHLPGRSPLQAVLFLSECAQGHAGVERPSDLLNGSASFLPARGPKGKMVFFHREAVVAVTVAARYEFGGDVLRMAALSSEEAVTADVEIVMEDETEFRGRVSYLMPVGSRRLQDFLNLPDRFLVLRDGDRVQLLNKNRILHLAVEAAERANG